MTAILTVSLLILAVLFIRALFRKSISPVLVYGLWLCVVIKLCIPFSLYDVKLPYTPEKENLGSGYVETENIPIDSREEISFPEGEGIATEKNEPDNVFGIDTEPIKDGLNTEQIGQPDVILPITPVTPPETV